MRHQRKLERRIEAGIKAKGGLVALLTLTSRPGMTVERMMRAWNRYKGWLRRQVPGVQYAAVKEFGTASGMLHLHVVLVGWRRVSQRELSARWERCSGARVVDIRKVEVEDGGQAARYVTKYVGKGLAGRDLRQMVSFSRGWVKDAFDKGPWRATGERWERSGSPAVGRLLATLGAGCLVVAVGECACLEYAHELELEGHLFLQGLQGVDSGRRAGVK